MFSIECVIDAVSKHANKLQTEPAKHNRAGTNVNSLMYAVLFIC